MVWEYGEGGEVWFGMEVWMRWRGMVWYVSMEVARYCYVMEVCECGKVWHGI